MVRVRLKKNCAFMKMNTPYGLVTHEWTNVRDNAYIYKEMEVEGGQEVAPIEVVQPVTVVQPIVEPVIEKPIEEIIEKKFVLKAVKKKTAKRRRKRTS